jgi:glycerophosphoryl diester phosphodiesterase
VSGPPLVVAHRAGNRVERVAPAVAAGADLVEIDVHLRRGRLEVRHPRRIGPLLWDRAGLRLAPRRPLLLEEVLEALPAGARPMLDLKQGDDPGLARAALAACRSRGAAPVTIASRRWSLVDAVAAEPDVDAVHSAAGARELGRLLARTGARRPRTVCARRDLLSEEVVAHLLGAATAVFTWPVDDLGDAALLTAWGVGGLICDDLGVVQELVRNRGRIPPRRGVPHR